MKNKTLFGVLAGTVLVVGSSGLLISKHTIEPEWSNPDWKKDWGYIVSKPMKAKDVKYIVLHSTSVDADAHQVCNSMGCRPASWHYTVDEKYIINSYPLTYQSWHVGCKEPLIDCYNANSISIEMCQDGDQDPNKVVANTRQLLIYLREEFPNTKLVRHFDATGKNCPLLIDEETFKSLKQTFEKKQSNLITPFNEKRKHFLNKLGEKVKLTFK